MKNVNERAYTWMLVIYGMEITDLQETLNNLQQNCFIGSYAYILHDKDIYTDVDREQDIKVGREPKEIGDNKTPHIHLILTFKQNVSRNQIINRFIIQDLEKGITILTKVVRDKYASYRYLTHKDNMEKTQYNENDIIGFNVGQYISKLNTGENTKYIEMFNDYANHETFYNMMVKYGRDFIINYKAYKEYFELIINEK